MNVKMAYDDHEVESFITGLECTDLSLAVQSAREEVDINTIVRRFGLTGQLPSDVAVPTFGDFSSMVVDYQSALNLVIEADEAFGKMPADVRARFGNDAQAFVAFASDEKNRDEARKLGLLVPEEPKDELLEAVRALKPGPVETKTS